MRIVVTGVSGFLGGAVLKNLTDNGFECIGVSRRGGVGHLQVTDYSCSPVGDVLIHLAEINDRAYANQLSSEYENMASRTLHALLSNGYSKVIYASSGVVYGDDNCKPHKETDPVNASDIYTCVKMASEHCVLSRGGVVARFSNIYGPGMATGNVLSHILSQIGNSGPVRLKDTNPVRDFLWIEDAADAIVQMVSQSLDGVFNVGSGIGTSIRELAHETLKAANQSDREVLSDQSVRKASCIILDITKTSAALDWYPSVPLNEGLTQLINLQKKVN